MDDATKDAIIAKIYELQPIRDGFERKAQNIQEIISGLDLLLREDPKNIDCTDMTDQDITTYKDNLFQHADAAING